MVPNQITTTDLADFGRGEIQEAINLLNMWMVQGPPEGHYEDEVRVRFNANSGWVFLTNSEYQVAMIHGDKLEEFHSCFECGCEGFKEDFERVSDCKGCGEIAGGGEG